MKQNRTPLHSLLTRDLLLEMADDRSFERGESYARKGYVHSLTLEGEKLIALVSGTYNYAVELWVEDDELQSTCTCPVGMDDLFCKHCVAVGLTWLANPKAAKPQKQSSRTRTKAVTIQDVQQFLAQQDKSTLILWIIERANRDEDWRQQLFLKVASQHPQGLDLTTFRQALRNAIFTGDFIDWREVSGYTEGIDSVLNSIQELLPAHPQAVIELCEYAVPLMETALNSVDDSNGEVGSTLEEFLELHLQACELAPPDPITLAENLFQFQMESGFGSFSNAVETYAAVLGDKGIAHYRTLAEEKWQAYPDLTAKDSRGWDSKRSKLQGILEAIAKASGDLEALVAIKRRDLSSPRTHLAIAQLYHQDGQRDRALEWAESGLKAFEPHNSDLRDFVIEEYRHQGRIPEALEYVWQGFTQSISLPGYQKLKTQTEQFNRWPTYRNQAIAYIREKMERQVAEAKQTSGSRTRPGAAYQAWSNPFPFAKDYSLLVEIFLWEKQDDLAWQEAQVGGCSQQLWLRLAECRQKEHPEEALPIFQRQIEPLIQQTNNMAYANAVAFLNQVHVLMVRLHRLSEFKALVEHLRKTYKAKRNFIALLNRQKW